MELGTRPEPFTNNLKAPPLTGAQLWIREVIVGTGLVVAAAIVKFRLFDVPPPGAGLVTVTVAVPAEAMAADGIAAVS
jgi:hypothetical protein